MNAQLPLRSAAPRLPRVPRVLLALVPLVARALVSRAV